MEGIRPDKFQLRSPFETRVKEQAVEKGNSEEEIILSSISASDGWQVLVEEMDAIMDELEGSLSAQMEAGADFDSIGKTAVVKELVKSYIVRIKRKVSDAREAVHNV